MDSQLAGYRLNPYTASGPSVGLFVREDVG
jgi:hypothetical protein